MLTDKRGKSTSAVLSNSSGPSLKRLSQAPTLPPPPPYRPPPVSPPSRIPDDLADLYANGGLQALERDTLFYEFCNFPLEKNFFHSKPLILLLGPCSVGKTSFVKYLLSNVEYPGSKIQAIPSTEKVNIIAHTSIMPTNADKAPIPGNLLVQYAKLPFQSLASKTPFLDDLQGSAVASPLLEDLIIVDSPGILAGGNGESGEKVDLVKDILPYFIDRADLVIVFFDPSKINITGEFQTTMCLIRPYRNKLRVILNKADVVKPRSLLEAHGAIMWELGCAFEQHERLKIFLGSFQTKRYENDDFKNLFREDQDALLEEIRSLRFVALRNKLAYFAKRLKMVVYNAHVVRLLKDRCLPPTIGSERKKQFEESVAANLEAIFVDVSKLKGCNGATDKTNLPDLALMRKWLAPTRFDWKKLRTIRYNSPGDIETVEQKISAVLQKLTNEAQQQDAVEKIEDEVADKIYEGAADWEGAKMPDRVKREWLAGFSKCAGSQQKVSCRRTEAFFVENFNCPDRKAVHDIVEKADLDQDNQLDIEEWQVASFLLARILDGKTVPVRIPKRWVPPGKHALLPVEDELQYFTTLQPMPAKTDDRTYINSNREENTYGNIL